MLDDPADSAAMTSGERGYLLFRCERTPAPPPARERVEPLLSWRDRLRGLGLVGALPNGVGFGNLSVRVPGTERFLITGTATGGLATLGPEHIVEVVGWDLDANSLRCRGLLDASSESLSHAAIYAAEPRAGAVIHVHSAVLWERLLGRAPITDAAAEAGTPAMARGISALLQNGGLGASGLLVMGGHPDGLIAFGADLDEAGGKVLAELDRSA